GRGAPATLRTYCSAAASTSSRVAGGSKLKSGRMLRHMASMLPRTASRRRDAGLGSEDDNLPVPHPLPRPSGVLMYVLLSPADLQALLSGPAPRRPGLVDVRWALGSGVETNRSAYLEAHLPGAVFLDLETALSDPVRPDGVGGRHPMPSLERVEQAFRAVGIGQDRAVVFYDGSVGLGAARAWWVASYYGVRAAVLDGGLAAWAEAGLPVRGGEVRPEPGDVRLVPGGRELLGADGLAAHLEAGGQALDARPADRFHGRNETIDPVPGHVPGALSLPALSLVDEGRLVDSETVVARL